MVISVVIPNLNGGKHLKRCIESLLSQKFCDLELIVIDGGSSDESLDIIAHYESSISNWVSEPDQGQYDAINKGFSLATGDVFYWLNSDDISLPWTLATVSSIFNDCENVDWLTGIPSRFVSGVMRGYTPLNFLYPKKLVAHGFASNCFKMGFVQQESTFWRRKLWEKIGSIPLEYKLAGDFWLWKALAEHSDLVTVDAVLGGFHFRKGQRSEILKKHYLDEVRSIQMQDCLYQKLNKKLEIGIRLNAMSKFLFELYRIVFLRSLISSRVYSNRWICYRDKWTVEDRYVSISDLM